MESHQLSEWSPEKNCCRSHPDITPSHPSLDFNITSCKTKDRQWRSQSVLFTVPLELTKSATLIHRWHKHLFDMNWRNDPDTCWTISVVVSYVHMCTWKIFKPMTSEMPVHCRRHGSWVWILVMGLNHFFNYSSLNHTSYFFQEVNAGAKWITIHYMSIIEIWSRYEIITCISGHQRWN